MLRCKKIAALITAAALLLCLCSCSSEESSASFAYPVLDMPEVLDPQIASNSTEWTVIENCMEGLVGIDENSQIIPAAAEDWDISADGLVYTFHLRSGMKWNFSEENREVLDIDGDLSVTAEDFAYAVKRAVSKRTGTPDFSLLSNIKGAKSIHDGNGGSLGVKATDSQTLVIQLENRDDDFLYTLLSSVYMPCNKEFFLATGGRYGRSSKYFLSNGQFTLSSWGEQSVTLSANSEYTGENAAKPTDVTLYLEDSQETALKGFEKGTYDAVTLTGDEAGSFEDYEDYIFKSSCDTTWVLACNFNSTYGSNYNMRKALITSAELPQSNIPEHFSQSSGIVPDVCTVSGSDGTYRESAGAVASAGSANGVVSYYESALDELESETASFTVICPDFLEGYTKVLVQSWQKNLGTSFAATIESLSLDELEQTLDSGDYTVAICPLRATSSSAVTFLESFALNDNIFGYSSGQFNSLLSSQESVAALKSAEKYLISGSYLLLPVLKSESYYLTGEEVNGVYFYDFSSKVNFVGAYRGDS